LDLNYDALAPIGDPEEVEVSGAERTTFIPPWKRGRKCWIGDSAGCTSRSGYYYRSDHFSLARVGIPSFSIGEGLKFKGHDEAWVRHRNGITWNTATSTDDEYFRE